MPENDRRNEPDANTLRPPTESAGDKAHILARAGLSAIPYVGGAAAELLQMVIAPPIRKRQREWMEAVAEGLRKLEERKRCIVDDLKDNEAFIDTVLQASPAAIRSSQQEKLDALRNAVLNAALPNPPEQSLQQMFIAYVDTFTVWHLKILSLLDLPSKWFETNRPGVNYQHRDRLVDLLICAFPELHGKEGFYKQVFRDLHDRGLININVDSTFDPLKSSTQPNSQTTDFGKRFLEFIAQPKSRADRSEEN